MDGRTGGRADGRTGGRAGGRTGGRADSRTGGQVDRRIDTTSALEQTVDISAQPLAAVLHVNISLRRATQTGHRTAAFSIDKIIRSDS